MKKEEKVFKFIVTYKLEHDGNSPSFREIMNGCDVQSASTVSYYLDSLAHEGYLKLSGVRQIEIVGGHYIPPYRAIDGRKLVEVAPGEFELQEVGE